MVRTIFRRYLATSKRGMREFPRHKSLDMIIVSDDKVNLAEKKDKVFGCFETVKGNLTLLEPKREDFYETWSLHKYCPSG